MDILNENDLQRQLDRFLAGELTANEVDTLTQAALEHPHWLEKLDEYQLCLLLDGVLEPPQADILRMRLTQEPHLRETFRQYETLNHLLGDLAAESWTTEEHAQRERIVAAVDRHMRETPSRLQRLVFRPMRIGLAVAAMLLIGLSLLMLYFHAGNGEKNIPTAEEGIVRVELLTPGVQAAQGMIEVSMPRLPGAEGRISASADASSPTGSVIVSTGSDSPPEPQAELPVYLSTAIMGFFPGG